MGGRSPKAKGATGERDLRRFLEARGWTIADKETSGLAGDDLFAEDPHGVWWSIECKNVASLLPKYLTQAKTQAVAREAAINEQLKNPRSMSSRLGITFDRKHWLLVWKPSGYGNGTDYIVLASRGRGTRYLVWEN